MGLPILYADIHALASFKFSERAGRPTERPLVSIKRGWRRAGSRGRGGSVAESLAAGLPGNVRGPLISLLHETRRCVFGGV